MSQDALFEQLKHPNPNLRERAMADIAASRDGDTIPRLMGALDQEDVVYRRAAVKLLGYIGADAVPSLVDGLLNSPDVTVRGSCAKALAQVALNYPDQPFPAAGLAGLAQSLRDPNPVVNIASAMALGEIGSPAFDTLAAVLGTTDNPALDVSIVNAFAAIRDERCGEILGRLAEDESIDPYVKQTAVSALSRMDFVQQHQYPRSE
jgi:bilin biosynthesis protein